LLGVPPRPLPNEPLHKDLLELPTLYQDLYLQYLGAKCVKCGREPDDPALCLACGRLVCCSAACCRSHAVGSQWPRPPPRPFADDGRGARAAGWPVPVARARDPPVMVETGAGASDDDIISEEEDREGPRREVDGMHVDDDDAPEGITGGGHSHGGEEDTPPPEFVPPGDETGEVYAPPAEAADVDSPGTSSPPRHREAPPPARPPGVGPALPRPHPTGARRLAGGVGGAGHGRRERPDVRDNDDDDDDDESGEEWDDVEFDEGEDDEAVVLRVICAGRVSMAGAEGECYSHARQCAAGSACYLMLRSTRTSVLRGSRAHSAPSLYLDAHGEEDLYMRRGCPLYLNQQRYDQLRALYRTAAFDYDTKALDRTLSNASYH